MSACTRSANATVSRRLPRLLPLLLVLLVLCVSLTTTSAHAFRFTAVPGKVKCFTYTIDEPGRYELHYRMVRTLTPFVSVAVTAPNGNILLEHETARPDAREVVVVRRPGPLGICFNTAEKALSVAVSPNISLSVLDAEDAALTRMTRQRYSTSTPIALGVRKGTRALLQAQSIAKSARRVRQSMHDLLSYDTKIRVSYAEIESMSWSLLYIFVAIALSVTLVNYWRLRRALRRMKVA